jgi:signal transduction histidine kinase
MIKPGNEEGRLKQLASYDLLDTLPEQDFDDITKIASEICHTEISLISLIDEDRKWIKSHHGTDLKETAREHAFCAHAINYPDELFMVKDARKDDRFRDNPMVSDAPNIVFYAGFPLVDKQGYALGSLCVIDHKPKELNDKQISSLRALSKQVINLIELRKRQTDTKKMLQKLEIRNKELEEFAFIAAHDIKSPIYNINSLAYLLMYDYGEQIDDEGKKIVNMIRKSAQRLGTMIDNLLEYRRSDKVLEESFTDINLPDLMQEVREILVLDDSVSFELNSPIKTIYSNKTALVQVLINLVTNAIKYNDKEKPVVVLKIKENEKYYSLSVIDNGPGIPEKMHQSIFDIFMTAVNKDRDGMKGSGIGLATVKKLVTSLGGDIWVKSVPDEGTSFIFTLEKRTMDKVKAEESLVP